MIWSESMNSFDNIDREYAYDGELGANAYYGQG